MSQYGLGVPATSVHPSAECFQRAFCVFTKIDCWARENSCGNCASILEGAAAVQVCPPSVVFQNMLLPMRMSQASDGEVTERYPVVPVSGSVPMADMSFERTCSPGALEAMRLLAGFRG